MDGRTDTGGAMKDFYMRRYLRICPMYFLVLLLTAIFNVEGARDSLPWNAFFLANMQTIVTGQWNGRFAPLWSLSFLEQFYLIWPFVVLLLPRRRLASVLLFVIALGPAWRLICYLARSLGDQLERVAAFLMRCGGMRRAAGGGAAGDGGGDGAAPADLGCALDRGAGFPRRWWG